MIGIFVICFVVFPIVVFMNVNKVSSSDIFFDKKDSDAIKGIATSFVILAHLTVNLKGTGGGVR